MAFQNLDNSTKANEYFALGCNLADQGLWTESKQAFLECLALKPDHHEAYNNLGAVLQALGSLPESESAFRQAIALEPNYCEAYSNLGVLLKLQNKANPTEIIQLLRKAIELNPNYAAAYYNLALMVREQKDLPQAEQLCLKAIALEPNYADAYNNLGIIYREQGLWKEAEKALHKAISIQPNSADAYHNLGILLWDQDLLDQAQQATKKAISLKRNFAEAYHQLGLILKEQGHFTEALEAYRQALKANPNYPEAILSQAITLLLLGDFATGLPAYESRWLGGKMPFPHLPGPLWDGRNVQGKTILLVAEQGLGDTLQFVRYAKVLNSLGATVNLVCQEPLVKLFSNDPHINTVISNQEPIKLPYDFYIPLLTVPKLLGTTLENIPAEIPYIKSTKTITLPTPPGTKVKVGIVWASGYRDSDARLLHVYHKKSCSLDLFAQLLEIEGVTLYSLQVGKDAQQLEKYKNQSRIVNMSSRIQDFTDTGAMIEQLDLVICIDTSVAHLAGAMGKPVWLLLPFVADWRWLLNRHDTPWYPTMRLFRQPQAGDWQSVFKQIISHLKFSQHSENNSPEAYNQLGATLYQQGLWEEAKEAINKSISLNPDYAEAYYNLGIILIKQGLFKEGEGAYRQVIRLFPQAAEAYYNLGVCLKEQNLLTEAQEAYAQTIKLKPDYAQAYQNLGVIAQETGDIKTAISYFRQAIEHKQDYAKAYNNLGVSYTEEKNFIEAQKAYRQAIKYKPDYHQAYHNLGVILTEQRLLKPAIEIIQECVAIKPDFAEAHFSLAFALLLEGDLVKGFKEYEWRFLADKIPYPQAVKPVWDGSDLRGKTILVFAEQGLGDTLQFIRYVPLLTQQGATVKIVCQTPLVELLRNVEGVSQIFPFEDTLTASFDCYIALLSLPHLLGTTLQTIPAKIPYITATKSLPLPIPPETKFKVGIVWASGFRSSELKLFNIYKSKTCPVDLFVNLLSIPGVTLYSLQVGKDSTDLDKHLPHPQIVNLTPQIQDFTDTAAFVNQLDLVITVDTSVAHLIGAMGKPVWILLPHFPDWRWLLGRRDTPWYPTMRLFRQTTLGDWAGVMQEIALCLNSLIHPTISSVAIKQDYCKIAIAHQQQGNLPLAAENYRHCVREQPHNLDAYYNLANILTELGSFTEAEGIYHQLLTLKPDYPEAYNNLGVALTQQGLLKQATKAYEKAVTLKPDYAEGYFNLGVVLSDQGLLQQGENAYRLAIQINPEYTQAHYNLATNLLLAGKLTEGFREYEWRWRSHPLNLPQFSQPVWDGSNPQGKTILLIAEQGLGDTLQFVRYVPLLRGLGATVKLVCQTSLVDLLKSVPGIDEIIGFHQQINTPFDYYIHLLSIPRVFNTTIETIPKAIPYISATKTLPLETPADTKLKIGIVWASGYRDSDATLYNIYQNKTCPIEQFLRLISIPGITLYSLQVGKNAQDIQPNPRIINLSPHIKDFSDTAALVNQLDLVITVDTSVAHLAGAMGKPVWVLLPNIPDWRWFLGRNDTPWYPTMQLFRQPTLGDWQSVFTQIIHNLI